MESPQVIILAGPNGAGKTTASERLLRGAMEVDEFVNADTIAEGLSAFAPERVAMQAGRTMLARLRELAAERASFAFETTLASRTFAPWLLELMQDGYAFHLIFLWIGKPELSIARVRRRVELGGHDVPADTIRRRYARGIANFFNLYRPIATTWRVYDNSGPAGARLVAESAADMPAIIHDETVWRQMQECAANE